MTDELAMKRAYSGQQQAARVMWDWIWPAFFSEGLFAAFFVILPNPNLIKLGFAVVLLFAHGLLTYQVRYCHRLARLWFIFLAMWFFNFAFFSAGFAMITCFRFSWPDDAGYSLLILSSLLGVAYLTWRYYTPIMQAVHEQDTQTGRFDLAQGTFSLLIPPNLYEFKTPILRKVMVILLPWSGTLIAISAASGVHGGEQLLRGRDLGAGALSLVLAALLVGVATCAFYTYHWIRGWEKRTGRTMWIKGFEPHAASHS